MVLTVLSEELPYPSRMVHMRDMRAEKPNTRHERPDRVTKTKKEPHNEQHSVLAGHKTNDKGECSQ
jgi:hypothetical protein